MKKFSSLAFVVLVGLLLSATSHAAEPQLTIPTQGALRSAGGGPVTDGKYVMTFSIHDAATGGKTLWSEIHPVVSVKAGTFSVRLGSVAAAQKNLDDAKLPWTKPLWLGFRVSDDPELPRVRIGSVALAAHALSAASLTGAIDGKQIADASIAAKTIGFAYAGSEIKGGPAVSALSSEVAKDLQCTGCVSVKEMAFDGDVKLGNHELWAGKVVSKVLLADAATITALSSNTLSSNIVSSNVVGAGKLNAKQISFGSAAGSQLTVSQINGGKIDMALGEFGHVTATNLSANMATIGALKTTSVTGDGSKLTGIAHPPNPAGSCKVGEVVSGIDKDGKILCAELPESGLKGINSSTPQTCDASKRATLWFQPGTTATDKLSVCAKDSAGSYAWRKLYGSDPKVIQTGKCTSASNFCGGPNNTCTVKLTCPAGQLLTQVRLITQNCNGCTPSGNGSEQKQCAGKTECSLSFKHASGCCCDSDDYRTGYAKAICI